ncbi:hypothetical protein LEMLEM_LOCUS17990 [Lemmus lemmus]
MARLFEAAFVEAFRVQHERQASRAGCHENHLIRQESTDENSHYYSKNPWVKIRWELTQR